MLFKTIICLLFITCSCGTVPSHPQLDSPAREPDLRGEAGWTARANSEWKPFTYNSADIIEGSALDMSSYCDKPAGKYGRVIINENGKLAFGNNPRKRVIFFCNSFGCTGLLNFKSKDEIAQYAKLIVKQGYNMVRLSHSDVYFSQVGVNSKPGEIILDKEKLDKFDYFIYCLKANGIYIYLDAMTYGRGHLTGNPNDRKSLHKQIYFDFNVRNYWEKFVRMIFTHQNPYTGTRIIDEPAIAVVLFLNEHNSQQRQIDLLPGWRNWLKKKYLTDAGLRKAWIDDRGRQLLINCKTIDSLPLFETDMLSEISLPGRDARYFMHDFYVEMYDWLEKAVRDIGYKGLVSYYDWRADLCIQSVRNRVPVISLHTYHYHPTSYAAKGSVIKQISSISTAGNYFTNIVLSRYIGRPFLFTEYGHPFWNKYRYEEGLLFGSYSALNDLDCLCTWATPVINNMGDEPIGNFTAGIDPVRRAAQVTAGFAFWHRYVSPSPYMIEIPLTTKFIFDEGHFVKAINSDQSKLALLASAGISYKEDSIPSLHGKVRSSLKVPLFGTSNIRSEQMFSDVLGADTNKNLLPAVVDQMKKEGILPQNNKTDVVNGIFESGTGQLLMDIRKNYLQVITEKMEGACIDAEVRKGPVKLNNVYIEYTSIPSSLTVISLQGNSLQSSDRILVVYSTDALNTNMTFKSSKRDTLVNLGSTPALIRTGRFKIKINNNKTNEMKAWALGFDGKRLEELPLTRDKSFMELSVNTGKLKYGPSSYFEIARQ